MDPRSVPQKIFTKILYRRSSIEDPPQNPLQKILQRRFDPESSLIDPA
jgi:hypothetical protein